MPRLACLDQGTGLPVRKPAPQRYEHYNAGDLVHVDIEKLGRIPDAGTTARAGTGYAYLHHAVDDHTKARLLGNPRQRKEGTRCGFSGSVRQRSSPPTASRQGRAHRQRILLPLPGLRSSSGPASEAVWTNEQNPHSGLAGDVLVKPLPA